MVSIHVSGERYTTLSQEQTPLCLGPSGSILCTFSSVCSPVSSILHNKWQILVFP